MNQLHRTVNALCELAPRQASTTRRQPEHRIQQQAARLLATPSPRVLATFARHGLLQQH